MRKSKIVGWAATAIVTAGVPLTLAASAHAATVPASHRAVDSVTKIINRADNGGGGQWAYDNFSRELKVNYLGKSTDPAMAATPFMYYATVSDQGTFRDMPGALTPNQGGHFAGKQLRPGQVSGPMTGSGAWGVFYASQRAHNGLVPTVLRGPALNALYPSSTWPELAFPTGTTFSGVNEVQYDYEYHAVPVLSSKHVIIRYAQNWSDTSLNGDGQLQHDGNIRGVR